MKKVVENLKINVSWTLMIMVVFGSLLTSCYTKDDTPYVPVEKPKDPASYTATITVIDEATKNVLSDVTFMGLNPEPKGANGVYTFTPSTGGSYSFYVKKDGYNSVSHTINFPQGVPGDKISASVVLVMSKVKTPLPAPVYKVVGLVIEGGTANAGIANATVEYTKVGGVKASVTTDANGSFSIANITDGLYSFVISATGKESVALNRVIQKIPAGDTLVIGLTVPMYAQGTVEGKTYSISGLVKDVKQNVILNGTIAYSVNGKKSISIEITNGRYTIPNLYKDDVVVIAISSTGMKSTSFEFNVSQFAGTPNIVMDVYMQEVVEGENAGTVEKDKETVISVPETPAVPGNSVAVKTEVKIPAGTEVKDATGKVLEVVVLSTNVDGSVIAVPKESAAAATFITAIFGPAGTQFTTPISWTVLNPFVQQNVTFGSLELQWLNEAGVWVSQGPVSYSNGAYTAAISHFSSYRMVVTSTKLNKEVKKDSVSKDFVTDKFVNNATYSYTNKTGIQSVISIKKALETAGIVADTSVVTVLTKAIEGVVGKLNTYTEVEALNKTGHQMTVEQVLKAKTIYSIEETTFTFSMNGKDVVVKVSNTTTQTNGTIEQKDPHHTHGDHVTEGGAGGGTGGNL